MGEGRSSKVFLFFVQHVKENAWFVQIFTIVFEILRHCCEYEKEVVCFGKQLHLALILFQIDNPPSEGLHVAGILLSSQHYKMATFSWRNFVPWTAVIKVGISVILFQSSLPL